MQRRAIDFLVGLFMLAGLCGLLVLAYRVSSFSEYQANSTYTLSAEFDNVGGLKVRAPVTIGGVKIGQVSSIALDATNFRAKVVLLIDDRENNLPTDTSASIYTQGLLGSNYISLAPGFATQSFKDGDVISTTRSALILEDLIGQLMFKLTNGDSNKNANANGSDSSSSPSASGGAAPASTTVVSPALTDSTNAIKPVESASSPVSTNTTTN